MIMKQEADMRARVERSIRTRPHSSPPRGRRSGAVQSRGGTLLSPMQRNSQSTPALHAVFSPQVPYYAGGLEAQAREKRKWIARHKERRGSAKKKDGSNRAEKQVNQYARRTMIFSVPTLMMTRQPSSMDKKTRDDLRNKFGKDIIGPSPSLSSFQRLGRRPVSAIRPQSPDTSRFQLKLPMQSTLEVSVVIYPTHHPPGIQVITLQIQPNSSEMSVNM